MTFNAMIFCVTALFLSWLFSIELQIGVGLIVLGASAIADAVSDVVFEKE